MKKSVIIGFAFVWLFIFSFAAQASTANSGRKESVPVTRLTEAKPAKTTDGSKDTSKDGKAEGTLVSSKELLEYVKELEETLKSEDNAAVDQIGTLSLTEGIGKKRVKLFTGSKKLLGKGVKDNQVNLVLFHLADGQNGEKTTVILMEDTYEIGASSLFSAEIVLSRVGVNYLLVQVQGGTQEPAYQLYQIVVEDIKTKDKLESMTLQFTK